MAAFALCGTAFAGEYNASAYKDKVFAYDVFGIGAEVVFNVDQTVKLLAFDAYGASSLTLNFVGANTFSLENDLYMHSLVSIMGDDAAKASWGETLTSSAGEVKTLTLVSSVYDFVAPDSASFEGLTESGSITLGDAALTYMGFHVVNTAAEAEALITGDNQIALVANKGTKQLALVGKGAAPVPEPATATLSLLALAGLAARRKRK